MEDDFAYNKEESVVCIYTTSDDQVLLVQRGQDDEYEGHWHPPAGKMESDESPEVAGARETWEEAGIAPAYKEIGEARDSSYDATLHILSAEASYPKHVTAGSDTEAARWVSYEDLDDYDMPPTMELITHAAPYLQEHTESEPAMYGTPISEIDCDSLTADDMMDMYDHFHETTDYVGVYTAEYDHNNVTGERITLSTDSAIVAAWPMEDGRFGFEIELLERPPLSEHDMLHSITDDLAGTDDWHMVHEGRIRG